MRFDFYFEELPLLTVNGVQGALINGTATIDADATDRTWDVHSIELEGFEGMQRKPLPLDYKEYQWLFFAICDALEREPFASHIYDRIDEELIAAAEEAADRRYEQRREERMWGAT